MQQIIVLFTVLIMAISTTSFAAGDVYFGKYFSPKVSGDPNGSNPQFVSGVYVDHTLADVAVLNRITPYVKLETLMDAQNKDGSFHPISIRYDVGFNVNLYDGWYVGGSRMCWHPVDHGGPVDQYWLVKSGYKW